MTDQELLDNIIGFMAYDEGGIDTGIHDEVLKGRCKQIVDERREDDAMAEVFRKYCRWMLSAEGREEGFDLEDVYAFLTYLGDEFNWDVR